MLQEEILFVSEIVDSLRWSNVLIPIDEDDIKRDVRDRRVEAVDILISRLIMLRQHDWPGKLLRALASRHQYLVEELSTVHQILKSNILATVLPKIKWDLEKGIYIY